MFTLETIFEKEVSEITDQEADYMLDNVSQLRDEQKEKYAELLKEAKTRQGEQAKAEGNEDKEDEDENEDEGENENENPEIIQN